MRTIKKKRKTRYVCESCYYVCYTLNELGKHLKDHYFEYCKELEYPELSEEEVKLINC